MQISLPALVRPRCYAPDSGDAMLLEDVVREFAEEHERGVLEICGGPGSGRTKALEYLGSVLSDLPNVRYLDDPPTDEIAALSAVSVVVCVSTPSRTKIVDLRLLLAPWGDDELIEYLLAAHPEACASVMQRVLSAPDRGFIQGVPELWSLVLEQMAADRKIDRVKTALRNSIDCHLTDSVVRALAGDYAWAMELERSKLGKRFSRHIKGAGGSHDLSRILYWPQVRLLLAAERLYQSLLDGRDQYRLAHSLPRELVEETAALIVRQETSRVAADQPSIVDRLKALADDRRQHWQAMAASLLHACGHAWQPNAARPPNLSFAYLNGIAWPGVDLAQANLASADLSLADLLGAKLNDAIATNASLAEACLRNAALQRIAAREADFSQADLSGVNAAGGDFRGAQFTQARLHKAVLREADLRQANLSDADFTGADLSRACLMQAVIDKADFSAANFHRAILDGLPLCKACFNGASFVDAQLRGVDLEEADLPGANFHGANFSGANLTGSRMPQADLQWTVLRNAGLGDVQWEQADLRNANFTGSTFHLGSSRSGMLFTPHASEGTRTGFYTDDYEEQHFKRPEEVRKANLRGADLRGAAVREVDFYLVDLREAIYTADQLDHFRKCRAILSPA